MIINRSVEKNEQHNEILTIKNFNRLLKRNFKKFCVLFSIFVFSFLYIILQIPSKYKSEAILIPSSAENNMKLGGQLGGLAALAGVNIGASGNSKSDIAIEIIKSKDFIITFIKKYDYLAKITVMNEWDEKSKEARFNERIYNSKENRWLEENNKKKPTDLEAYEAFKENYSINSEKTSGIVKIAFTSYSPVFSKEVIDNLISEINDLMRERDIEDARKSIDYLSSKTKDTENVSIKNSIFSLIDEQEKILLLANVRKEYVLKTIDKAFIPEEPTSPNKLLLAILSIFTSFSLSFCILLAKDLLRK